MTIREEIDTQFPIRKTTAQKRAFEKWVMAKMREMGYRPYVDGMNRKDKLRHRNIVAGDPQNAELLISAHYDTAATIGIPDLRIPRNFPVYILSQGAVLLGMLLISLLIGTAVGLATKSGDLLILTFFFAYLALMLLMMFGAANKHNVNDNTSGIAALLETMQRLSPEAREKTAFILFDHQETGSRGAKSYGAQHVEVQTMKLLVDLNCVGMATRLSSAPRKWRRISRNTPPSANPLKKTQWHLACRRSSSGARVCKARAIIGASCAGWAYRHTTTARGWDSSPGASTLPVIPSADRKIWTISPKVSPTRLKK